MTLTTADFVTRFQQMAANVERVIKGKREVIELTLIGMLAEGHVLFEDMPGTGKTMLSRAISQTISADVARIQCTPDLLPADVTGSSVLDRERGTFSFRPGPVFTNVLLADEINRATPKTQSALLEAMAERRVTYDGVTRELPTPFFVLATMNPLEQAGTFPLPEAQLDRFMFQLSLGYAPRAAEAQVLRSAEAGESIEELTAVVSLEEFRAMVAWAKAVTISDDVLYYLIDLVAATRSDTQLQLGASSRASLALLRAAKVRAAAAGRDDVLPGDIAALAPAVLTHRLLLTGEALMSETTRADVVDQILHRVKVPTAGALSQQDAQD
ncbi:MAG: MoxR family ATPase [Bowdeniella nasicola]|nr:MoxR family ATPase [Bowdeniella nasicola]